MPTELLSALPQLASIVEKLGVIGVLLIVAGWLIFDRLRLMKQGARTFRRAERETLIAERYRGALVSAGAAVPDISDILQRFEEKED